MTSEGRSRSLRVVFKDDYSLLMANDGPRAIELARQNRIDVAITDIRMMGMSGVELLEHLKAVDPGIEVIMLTTYETVDTPPAGAAVEGACDYLNKRLTSPRCAKRCPTRWSAAHWARKSAKTARRCKNCKPSCTSRKWLVKSPATGAKSYASIIHDINGPL